MRHGSQIDPPNRFLHVHALPDPDHWEWDADFARDQHQRPIEYIVDQSQSIVSENNSPDIPFSYSVNPYRGCVHGCAYCYARNSHEYLGWNAGLDFETKIHVKPDAPLLLRQFLAREKWQGDAITFSGVTDCYQPIERQLRLTRQCLEVAVECRQAIGIVTKNALVVRDLDLLKDLATQGLVHVFLSINSLDAALARQLEPRTSIPSARLRAVSLLAEAGIPVGVMVAPMIPGLNDHEAPAVMQAARESGAHDARFIMLRLPLTVEPVFREWLQRVVPDQVEKVEGRLRHMRGGKLNSSNWGERMRGTGEIAEQFQAMFGVIRHKLGFHALPPLQTNHFRPPQTGGRQLRLF